MHLAGGKTGAAAVSTNIPLISLAPSQSAAYTCLAKRGTGAENVNFAPAVVHHQGVFEVTLPKGIKGRLAEEVRASCASEVFDIEDVLVVKRPLMCNFCRKCVLVHPEIKVEQVKGQAIVVIESKFLSPARIFRSAVASACDYYASNGDI